MVCDGHGGHQAASFVTEVIHELLEARLPMKLPQSQGLYDGPGEGTLDRTLALIRINLLLR